MRTISLIISLLVGLVAAAQTPQQMLDRAVNALKQGGNVTAAYAVKGSQGTSSGTITMSGSKYRILSNEMKCWYDGKTLWTYSTATGEVNITTPTAADLQAVNPYAAAQDFKRNFNMWKAAGQVPGCYAIMLMPKNKNNMEKLYLYIDTKSGLVQNVHVKMSDGSAFTITLSNYKTHVAATAATFTFDKTLVPPGTDVVDLR
ncbi:MAG: outer-membrane lipoprotein carrier protein LolA [Muribaculaceae bacterium]|nr:outer-membrane lipoprotein carrier protein LolA [Muribaculaceae bacterium]